MITPCSALEASSLLSRTEQVQDQDTEQGCHRNRIRPHILQTAGEVREEQTSHLSPFLSKSTQRSVASITRAVGNKPVLENVLFSQAHASQPSPFLHCSMALGVCCGARSQGFCSTWGKLHSPPPPPFALAKHSRPLSPTAVWHVPGVRRAMSA